MVDRVMCMIMVPASSISSLFIGCQSMQPLKKKRFKLSNCEKCTTKICCLCKPTDCAHWGPVTMPADGKLGVKLTPSDERWVSSGSITYKMPSSITSASVKGQYQSDEFSKKCSKKLHFTAMEKKLYFGPAEPALDFLQRCYMWGKYRLSLETFVWCFGRLYGWLLFNICRSFKAREEHACTDRYASFCRIHFFSRDG